MSGAKIASTAAWSTGTIALLTDFFMLCGGGATMMRPAVFILDAMMILTLAGAVCTAVLIVVPYRDESTPVRGKAFAVGFGLPAVTLALYAIVTFQMILATSGDPTLSLNRLKFISLAFHDYNKVYGEFPPAASYSPDGKPLLSWRVLILPFLDHDDLYRQFKLDEPWDSPHNLGLLDKMPPEYLIPRRDSSRLTHYQIFVGPGAAFEGKLGLRLADFTDGVSETILVIEAAEPVPWTAPEDLPYDPIGPLPEVGGIFTGRINAAFVDASVRVIPNDVSENTLRALITRNAGDKPGPDWNPQ
jgi:hypothetical protein